MAPRKTERILNLTICLLVSGRYLPKSRIREAVEGYHHLSDAAFERTFERDKDELRALGVPIEVGSFDPLFDDEPGYRILPSEFELPAIDLDAEEAAVVGVAARVWQHASMAESTQSALAKLRAAGVEPDTSQLAALEPSVQASEPAIRAVVERGARRVPGQLHLPRRQPATLEPWGMTSYKGRWYVIGRDVDRDADADVQAVPDDRPAQEGLARRRRTRCQLTWTCAAGPVLAAAGADRDRRCWPSAPAKPPRPCAGAASRRLPIAKLPAGFVVVRGRLRGAVPSWRRRSPSTGPTSSCWSRRAARRGPPG